MFNKALYLGASVPGTLVCPFQLRQAGIIVDEIPKQFSKESTHSLYATDDDDNPVVIRLSLRGIMSGFESFKPTQQEIKKLPRIIMTSDTPWNPSSTVHEENEATAAWNQRISSIKAHSDEEVDIETGDSSIGDPTYPTLPFDLNQNVDRAISATRTYDAMNMDYLLDDDEDVQLYQRLICLLYTSPSPRDA